MRIHNTLMQYVTNYKSDISENKKITIGADSFQEWNI